MERLETILGNLGLDGAMTEVFAYLADKNKATMEDIYEATALSRKAVSRALDALAAEGAVRREGEAFTIGDVREALLALLPARYEELKAEIYSYRPSTAEKACSRVEAISGDSSAVPAFAANNIDAALSSVDIISGSLAWLNGESLDAARAAVQRGVVVRVITFRHPGLKAESRALADAGVELRSSEYSEEARLMVVDGELIVFSLKEPACFALLVRDKSVSEKVLKHIFEPAWGDAEVAEKYRI
jgi:DNA-binding transcriptional ArsR family regulator